MMSEPLLETIRLPYCVPYYAQIASPELAEAIFVQGMDPARDPRWAESGAETPEEYIYWVQRACGVACLKMCVEALGGPVRSLVDWARLGPERGGYLVRRDEKGNPREVGRPTAFYVNNPSGRRAEWQANAPLPAERFAAAYSGRVIVIGAQGKVNQAESCGQGDQTSCQAHGPA